MLRSRRYDTIVGMTSRFRILVITLALAFAVRLVMMAAMPVFEPSEARYAAISANMARTGDYLSPSFTYRGEYQAFKGKPPLVFQCGGALCRLAGVSEFAVRLTPFLSFVLLLCILFQSVKSLKNASSAWLAVGICATSTALYAVSGVCMTDVPLTCCSSGALLVYARSRQSPRMRDAVLAGLLLGCGMLVKGPVALVLFGLPVLVDGVVNRNWRLVFSAKWLWSVAVFLAVSAPWFVLMQREHPDFLRYFFLNENLLRFLRHDYGDRYGAGREAFHGVSVVWALVVTLPWALFPLCDAVKRRWSAFDRRDFFLVSAVAVTAFWCMTSRVPLAYLLPVVPLFAAWLASSPSAASRLRLWRAVPAAAAIASAVTVAMLVSTLLFTDKMLGKNAPKRASKRHFAYEFYHGPWGEGAPR